MKTPEQDPFSTIENAVAVSWQLEKHNYDPRSAELTEADVARARQLIDVAFYDKVRSASGAPYVVHLRETEALICGAGYADDIVLRIAGLLHDGPEDVGDRLGHDVIVHYFGEDVARLVSGVTKESHSGQYWREGWQQFIDKLRGATDERVIMLELADRNSNLRDALRNSFAPDTGDGRKVGPNFWSIYTTSTPEDQLWMYEQMLVMFKEKARGRTNPLLEDFAANVATLRDVIEAYKFQHSAQAVMGRRQR